MMGEKNKHCNGCVWICTSTLLYDPCVFLNFCSCGVCLQLLQNLQYADEMTVLCVHNGSQMLPPNQWDEREFIKRCRQRKAVAWAYSFTSTARIKFIRIIEMKLMFIILHPCLLSPFIFDKMDYVNLGNLMFELLFWRLFQNLNIGYI